MDTFIIILIIIAIGVMVLWAYFFSELIHKGKLNQADAKRKSESATLTKKAKLEAQVRMAKAVEKETAALQKSLRAEAASIAEEFKNNLQQITSNNIREFNETLQKVSSTMSQEAKVLVEATQKQSFIAQKSIDEEAAKVKAEITEKVENKFAEIMVSYLAEVAGDLDYHQQKDYLYKSLEANKDAIKKDLENAV